MKSQDPYKEYTWTYVARFAHYRGMGKDICSQLLISLQDLNGHSNEAIRKSWLNVLRNGVLKQRTIDIPMEMVKNLRLSDLTEEQNFITIP